jgi:hypothetical protein
MDNTGAFPAYIELDKRRGDDDSLSGLEIFTMRKNTKSLYDAVVLIHKDLQEIKEMYLNHQIQIKEITKTVDDMHVILKEYRDRQGFVRTVKKFSKPLIWIGSVSTAVLAALGLAKYLK